MANSLEIQADGIIASVYEPTQSYDTIHATTNASQELIEQLRTQGKPVKILIDLSQVTHQDTGARKAALEGIVTLQFDKMAIFGATLFIKHVAQFIIQVTGKREIVRYFTTKEEAMSWLTS